MLRALLEEGIVPTSSWARRSARSTEPPSPSTRRRRGRQADRVWRSCRRHGPLLRLGAAPGAAPGPHAHPRRTRTSRCAGCSTEQFGDDADRGPRRAVPVRRREHRAGRRALVHRRPARRRGPGQHAPFPGVLPPVRIGDEHFLDGGLVNSIPVARAVTLGARHDLRAAGRVASSGRWWPRRRPWEVATVAFEIARRHRFAHDMATLPDSVVVHVLPTGAGEPPRLRRPVRPALPRLLQRAEAHRRGVRRVARPTCATRAGRWADRAASRASSAGSCSRPLLIVLTVARAHGPARAACWSRRPPRRCCPAGGGRCGCSGWCCSTSCSSRSALVVLFALWVASGFGWRIRSPRFQRAHYAIVRWFLQVLFWECQRVLHVRVAVEGPPPTSYDGRPLLILSRHAGPGDSFLVVHALVNWYAREPRIVLKDTLQWDPAIDVLLNRLPNRFIRPEPGSQRRPRRAAGRRAGAQPRRERRLRHLPRGRQLHRAPAQAGDRAAAPQGPDRRGESAPNSCGT